MKIASTTIHKHDNPVNQKNNLTIVGFNILFYAGKRG